MKTKFVFSLILAVMSFALLGCDRSVIAVVQDTAWNDSPTLTTGQALNNRKNCDSTTWTTFTDDRDRTTVEYRCRMSDIYSFIDPSFKDKPEGAKTVDEVIQWIIPAGYNDHLLPPISYFGRVITYNNGKVDHQHYLRPDAVAAAIADNTATNLKDENRQIDFYIAAIDRQ